MTHEQMYEAVRAKVIEACPDAAETIRLSHVLRAIVKQPVPIHWVAVDCFGDFIEKNDEREGGGMEFVNYPSWNLALDDLSQQDPEVIKFLFNILCEK